MYDYIFIFCNYFYNYNELCNDQLLVLLLHGGNTICLSMRPRCRKHPKQIQYDASNLITVPITPYYETPLQNVNIGLIHFQSICNKSDEISYVVKD